MNDAEIGFQICMNDLFCFGERQFTERAHRPDDTSFETERRENDFSLLHCWCEHFSSAFFWCDTGGVSGVYYTLRLVTPIVDVV